MTDSSDSRESQRRQATVFFADISGFTAMSEKLDPEDVTEIMNDCFAMVERIVHDHGGQIDKYIGDAVMALFGAGQALENAAKRGVAAAIEIRSGLERFNETRHLPVPLLVHIGVNSGLVIAGEVGGQVKRDFTVMGDTVNLAARLEDASEKGQIFVGPGTYAATREDFEYRPTKKLALKGKSEPVQAYEVLGRKEKADVPKLGAATRQISSELVGREAETTSLRSRLTSFVAGRGGIVSIVGEAGLGKSRLLAELSTLPELARVTVLVGRSDAVGSGSSYHPFVDLLREWAGIKTTDTEDEAVARLEAAVRSLAAEGAGEILPFVATLMGMRLSGPHAERIADIDPDAMEKLILKAMTDLLVLLGGSRPLLLCFEDLHWADLSSVKLLESVMRLVVDHPILFLFVTRPGFEETSERLLGLARGRHPDLYLEVTLRPLDQRSSATLIRNLLRIDNLPAATRDAITRRAEGNPFYMEEVVRALIDQGAVVVRDGRLTVTDAIHSVVIPGTIQEVILGRVERLEAPARRLLQIAAVLGRSFLRRLLLEVAGGTESEIAPVLAVLKERQVLAERQVRDTGSVRRKMLTAQVELTFQHALIQETIYESMLNRTRRDLHLRTAEAIEALFADRLNDFYPLLALHYSRAEKLEQAEKYLVLAGEEAARSAASSEALGYFREAYRIYDLLHRDGGDPAKKLLFEKNIALALLLTGNLAEARPHFDRALQLLGERVPRTRNGAHRQLAFDVARILFRVFVLRGRMSRRPATPELQEALSLLYSRARVESVADPEWFLFDSMYGISRLTTVDPRTVESAFAEWAGGALMFAFSGISFRISRTIAEIAASVLREDRPADLFTYELMGFMCDYFEGRWDRPTKIDDALVARTMRTGQLWDVDTFLGMDAYKQIDQGNFAAAEARWRTICEIAGDYGYGFAETNKLAIPLFVSVARRDLDRALEQVDRYLERPEEMLNLIGLGNKAKILMLLDRPSEAEAILESADALISRMNAAAPFHTGWYRTAKLAFDVSRLESLADAGDRRAVSTVRRRGAKNVRTALRTAAALAMIRTETYRLVGTYHRLIGSRRRAVKWWERSLAEGAKLGARPELARTHAEIARWQTREAAAEPIGGKTAAEHAEAARSSFTELRLDWDLEQLERRLGRDATAQRVDAVA